jgi:hypothetical protein
MKKMYVTFVLLGFYLINLFSVTTLTVPGQYATILSACYDAVTLTGDVVIEVSYDIYDAGIFINLGVNGPNSLSIIGLNTPIIDCSYITTAPVYVNYDGSSYKHVKISGFEIINASEWPGILVTNPISCGLDIEISKNIIYDSSNGYENNGGIQVFNAAKCFISNNTISRTVYSADCIGILIHDNVNNVLIEDNSVSNFEIGIKMNETSGSIINNSVEITHNYSDGIGVYISASCVDVINNLIKVYPSLDNHDNVGINDNFFMLSTTIINNTIIGFGENTTGYKGTTDKFINNIMWDLDQNLEIIPSEPFEVNYCCFNGTIPDECQPASGNNYNTNSNPEFTVDYHLSEDSIWLIDHADPDTDDDDILWQYDPDDRDVDGTRMDMGCYPYLHDYDTKVFTKGVHWISFPILTQDDIYEPEDPPSIYDQIFQDAYYLNNDGGLLQDESGNSTILGFERIDGKRFDTEMSIIPDGPSWDDYDSDFNNMLFRHEGYKISIDDDITTPTELPVGNSNNERLPTNHEIAGTMGFGEYHWIGYWLLEPQNIVDAFGGNSSNPTDNLWRYVEKVKAEDWYYDRCSSNRGAGAAEPVSWATDSKILEYGKMYMVWFKDQSVSDFKWYTSSTVEEPTKKEKSENFDYTEKPDYEVIDVVDIPENVSEIGVFEEDTCVGAVVVQNPSEQILVYSDNANRDQVPFSFEIITNGRSINQPIMNYTVFNVDSGEFENGYVVSGQQESSVVMFGDIGEPDDNVPVIEKTQLYNNYPNPFNPETNISFSIPVEQKVKITIYNLKGQKVRQLLSGQFESGRHSVVWEGKDDNGKQVGSGLYFYKLKTDNKEFSKKMLLLK